MSSEASRAAPAHEVQIAENACVLASICMVLRAHGSPTSQQTLRERLVGTRRGYSLRDAATLVSGRYLEPDIDDPSAIEWLRAQSNSGRLLILQMFAARLHQLALARGRDSGPFGPLPSSPGFLHAIVVVGTRDRDFLYLDPWFEGADQPFSIGEDALAEAWQAGVLVVYGPPVP